MVFRVLGLIQGAVCVLQMLIFQHPAGVKLFLHKMCHGRQHTCRSSPSAVASPPHSASRRASSGACARAPKEALLLGFKGIMVLGIPPPSQSAVPLRTLQADTGVREERGGWCPNLLAGAPGAAPGRARQSRQRCPR